MIDLNHDAEDVYQVEFKATISPPFTPVGFVYIRNGCCKNRPVIITENELANGKKNYSAQCACGGWCTTGCKTASDALQHYERMTAGENLYGG